MPDWRPVLKCKLHALELPPLREEEIIQELDQHLNDRYDEFLAQGQSDTTAYTSALRELDKCELLVRELRRLNPPKPPMVVLGTNGGTMFSNLGQDCRYALRMMIKRPLFSIAIILTLGVCIGAVTAVFSAVDATILKSLPYPEPEQLAQLVRYTLTSRGTGLQQGQNGRTWEAFKAGAATFEAAAYGGTTGVNFSSGNQISYIQQQRVTAGFFKVLGIQPILGREFSAEEDRPGGRAVVVLSHDLWRRSFNSNPSVIGQAAMVAGEAYEVVGVASPAFRSNVDADIWTPLRPSTTGEGQGINYTIIGRVRSGAPWPQAQAEVRSIGDALIQSEPPLRAGVSRYFSFMNLQDSMIDGLRTPLILILGVTLLVLLIGCSNVAGMLLSRGAARHSEIATRMALGAGRGAVVRQLLVENLGLGVASGLVGIGIGYLGIEVLKAQQLGWDVLQRATVDLRVLGAMVGVSIVASMLFGIFPAVQAGRVDIRSAQMGRGILGGTRSLVRRVLPVFQVGIAVFLLIGATLLVRSFSHLWTLDPGFEATNVITASFSMRDARYKTAESISQFYSETLRRLHEVSGVESAAVALTLPYERGLNMVFNRPGDPQGGNARLANVIYASAGFFNALRIPLMRGRLMNDADSATSMPVIVVNDAFARLHFNSEDPIGAQLELAGENRQIVGIVGNVQQQAGWGNYGPMGQVPSAYVPATQVKGMVGGHIWYSPRWIIRTHGPQGNLQQQIDDAVRSVDPLLPIASFQTLHEVKARAFAWNQFLAASIGFAASLALLLSIIGTYAMISNSVVERTREFGIRMALGATLAQTVRSAARPGILCAVAGLAVGVTAARLETKLLDGLVYGVTTTDSTTFLVVPIVVLIVATAASVIPALRIIGLDPAQTLRQE